MRIDLIKVKNGNYWTKFLVENNINWDLIRDGIIIYRVPFQGHKKTFGTFNYRVEIYQINVRMLVNKYFKNFTGNENNRK